MSKTEKTFLLELQEQAKVQSKLEDVRFFPKLLDPVMSLIGNYPWQILLLLSGFSAIVWRLGQIAF
jgi:hypothetical protein